MRLIIVRRSDLPASLKARKRRRAHHRRPQRAVVIVHIVVVAFATLVAAQFALVWDTLHSRLKRARARVNWGRMVVKLLPRAHRGELQQAEAAAAGEAEPAAAGGHKLWRAVVLCGLKTGIIEQVPLHPAHLHRCLCVRR